MPPRGEMARVTAPVGGSPLSALMGLPIWPQVTQLLAKVPELSAGASPLPQAPAGMPEMPPPPPGMFSGAPAGGLLQPVRVPDWFGKLQPAPAPGEQADPATMPWGQPAPGEQADPATMPWGA